MLKTIIVLPDGREITSGTDDREAVQSITFTESVNDSQELSLGSACANMVEVTLITPGGSLPIAAGDELTVYREDDSGVRHKLGLYTTEKPTRPSANTMELTAFDRISWLDRDLTVWLAGLDGWPYKLLDFARMVCAACDLRLVNETLPNGDYLVQKFSADGITGRQLLRWAGQIAGRFCRATPEGELEFAWYEPAQSHAIGSAEGTAIFWEEGNLSIVLDGVTAADDGEGNVTVESDLLSVTDDGEGNVCITVADTMERLFYYMNGLRFEDYAVKPIEKVQLRQNEEDVGTVFPDTAEVCNTYSITGNYLLTATAAEDLEPVAETLYEQLKNVTYTPCKVELPANPYIRAGNIVRITDSNGRTITAYIMTRTQRGQRDTLECTGSFTRESSGAVNNQTFKAYMGKVLNLRTDVEGLKAENKDAVGNLARLEMSLEGISTEVVRQDEQMGTLQTQMQQTAEDITLQIGRINQTITEGVAKVDTKTGFTFSQEGLRIEKTGTEMSTLIDEKGMTVSRFGGVVLQATAGGVNAVDVTVNNYLQVGDHARFEDYTDGADSQRTACFFT